MKRDLDRLTRQPFDLLVIGGGIYGACVAWDGAQRGLSVALLERGDFGGGTSANSLKVIHGGLRYLQEGNLSLVRRMARERAAWLRIAPHFVRPQPFAIPTFGRLSRHRAVMRAALLANDWLSAGRNRGLPPAQRIPAGRILSRTEFQARTGWLADGITGGALWTDAQMIDSERLLLAFLLSAAAAGAQVANQVAVNGLTRAGGEITGVTAVDRPTGRPLEIRAELVVNCAGAWSEGLLPAAPPAAYPQSVALNLVTRPLPLDCSVGLPGRPAGGPAGRSFPRTLFLVPWEDATLIGTLHLPWRGAPDEFQVTDEMIGSFLDGINRTYPPARLAPADVRLVHHGFLPLRAAGGGPAEERLLRDGEIWDHARQGGPARLLTVIGVKYTMARFVAEKTIDLALARLRRPAVPCRTRETPLFGAEEPVEFRLEAAGIPAAAAGRLARTHGRAVGQIAALLRENPAWGEPVAAGRPVIQAEVIHAVRAEMALSLDDVVRRRLPLGAAGYPGDEALAACAGLMAGELDWDPARQQTEREAVRQVYPRHAQTAPAGENP